MSRPTLPDFIAGGGVAAGSMSLYAKLMKSMSIALTATSLSVGLGLSLVLGALACLILWKWL